MHPEKDGLAFLRHYPEPAFMMDISGTILDANKRFTLRFIQKSDANIIGRNIFDDIANIIGDPELAAFRKKMSEAAIQSKKHVSFEDEQDGRIWKSLIFPILNQQEEVSCLVVIAQDVTNEKQLEKKRQNELTVFNALLDAVPGTVIIADEQGNITAGNQMASTFTGNSPHQQQLSNIFSFVHPDELEQSRTRFFEVIATGNQISFEARLMIPEEQCYRWFSLNGSRIMIDDRPHMLGVGIDINERKQAEIALIENERKLNNALEATNAGWWEWDIESGAIRWSELAWMATGLEKEHTRPDIKLWLHLIHPEDRERMRDIIRKAASGEIEYSVEEYRVALPDKPVIWVLSHAKPIRDQNGAIVQFIGTFIDITSRKQAEAEYELLQQQLLQSQKMELLGKLAGGIAHDFNNSLTSIIGNIEMALSKIDTSLAVADNLRDVHKSGLRSAHLTQQLLGFTRKQMAQPKAISMNQEITRLLPMLRSLVSAQIRSIWLPDRTEPVISIDPAQLDQILSNLFVNARDAIGESGTITIRTTTVQVINDDCAMGHPCQSPGDYALLSVSDNGSGIENAVLPHIFEPFFTTKPVGKGTGLGLSTVYGIIKQNNGYIDCKSESGQGTTFSLFFPIHQNPVQKTDIVTTPQNFKIRTETVLLVEDEPNILKILRISLEEKGFEVLAALDAETALIIAETHKEKIRLLVSDIMLPGMSGIELNRQVEQHIPGIKSLFMSGFNFEENHCLYCAEKPVNFLRKPFSINDFLKLVYRILQPADE